MPDPIVIPAARLRKLALVAQGLAKPKTFGVGTRGAQRAIEHLGYVQIDTISVVERAHHHTLWTRVPGYTPAALDKLMKQRRIFEYWFHAAAFLPMRDYRFALPRMHAIRNGGTHWFKHRERKLEQKIIERIRAEGPLRTKDFEGPKRAASGWWNWKPAKISLETLYMEGTLMSTAREGFAKVYDLAERVLPSDIDLSLPTTEEYADYLIITALRSHAFAAEKEFAYGRRGTAIRQAIRARLNAGVSNGELVLARCLGSKTLLYVDAHALDMRTRITPRVSLLSPFDNSLIQRDRMERIHEWDYQIECYVPGPKRRFGYFCLPILFGDRFVGRADCKADRKTNVLKVVSLHIERDDVDLDAFAPQLAATFREFMAFNGCDALHIGRVLPKKHDKVLRRFLAE